jgi:hypothetical protein
MSLDDQFDEYEAKTLSIEEAAARELYWNQEADPEYSKEPKPQPHSASKKAVMY